MALGDDYISAAELKAELGIGDSFADDQIGLAITAASEWVSSYCRRDFNVASSATARVFYPINQHLLAVNDIANATGLVVKTDEDDDGVYENTWTSADYQLEPLNQIVRNKSGWPYTTIRAVDDEWFPTHTDRASVEVTATWGWPAIPSAVKKATTILAGALYKRRDSAEGVLSGFGDFGPVRIGLRIDPHVEQLLADYRIIEGIA